MRNDATSLMLNLFLIRNKIRNNWRIAHFAG